MNKSRLEAFSDGVIAIIITIMVLELKVPTGYEWSELLRLWPKILAYVISFMYVGIYWNNHHHMLQTVKKINGKVLWANLHLLFWLSLFPFVSGWAGESHFAAVPMTCYGVVAFMSGLSYTFLAHTIIQADPNNHTLVEATKGEGKEKLSLAVYVVAIVAPFFGHWGTLLSGAGLIGIALLWLIPDRRIERVLEKI